MHRHVVVQIHFETQAEGSLPVAASTKRRGTGARITVEGEREAPTVGNIFVFYRVGAASIVIAGSGRRKRGESALAHLGGAGAAHRLPPIPGDGGGRARA